MNIEIIRNFFKADRYAMLTGANIDKVEEGYAECSMEIKDMHYNAGDVVQGGAIFTLADFAFAVASNAKTIIEGKSEITVNQSSSISYIKPPKGKAIIAKAKEMSRGRRTSVYRIQVYDSEDNLVADMMGNGYTVEI